MFASAISLPSYPKKQPIRCPTSSMRATSPRYVPAYPDTRYSIRELGFRNRFCCIFWVPPATAPLCVFNGDTEAIRRYARVLRSRPKHESTSSRNPRRQLSFQRRPRYHGKHRSGQVACLQIPLLLRLFCRLHLRLRRGSSFYARRDRVGVRHAGEDASVSPPSPPGAIHTIHNKKQWRRRRRWRR